MTPGFCVRKWHSWTTQIGTRGLSPTLRGSSAWRTAVVENSDDPIISCLSCALRAAERGNDQHCADVLRLAITVRRLRLRSEVRTAVEPVGIEPMRRQVCALQKWRLKRVVEYVDSHLSAKITSRIWLWLPD